MIFLKSPFQLLLEYCAKKFADDCRYLQSELSVHRSKFYTVTFPYSDIRANDACLWLKRMSTVFDITQDINDLYCRLRGKSDHLDNLFIRFSLILDVNYVCCLISKLGNRLVMAA